jgi:hypothetical protein
MPPVKLESATLFTPGKASYITTRLDGTYQSNLTEASNNRGMEAVLAFDPNYHSSALYAGGYPAIKGWPKEHIPPLDQREANLMAMPLIRHLSNCGWTTEKILERIHIQGESSDSIGDVAISIQNGYLDPNDYHLENVKHGIDLNTGWLHGIRFRMILHKALDIDPKLIIRLNTHDKYGTPKTEFESKESKSIAIAKEIAGIGLTYKALRDVEPGNLDDLIDAQEKLNTTISKLVS